MFKHILVPTDGSTISRIVEDRAIEFARETDAKITFLHVIHEPPFPVTDFSESGRVDLEKTKRFVEQERSLDKRMLGRALQQAIEHGVSAQIVTETDSSPYLAIINIAKERQCDLIFMASHGRRGLDALLLGSETQKVLTHSTVPVLVFR